MYKIPHKMHPLKEKPYKNNNYLSWLHNQGLTCFSCGKQNGIELHHVKRYSSDHKNDAKVIPLCGIDCHRIGRILSAHGTPKLFRETYSMESQEEYAKELFNTFKGEETL